MTVNGWLLTAVKLANTQGPGNHENLVGPRSTFPGGDQGVGGGSGTGEGGQNGGPNGKIMKKLRNMIRKKAWTCAQQVWKDGGLASEHQPPPDPLRGEFPVQRLL